jgi:hypothetical protein
MSCKHFENPAKTDKSEIVAALWWHLVEGELSDPIYYIHGYKEMVSSLIHVKFPMGGAPLILLKICKLLSMIFVIFKFLSLIFNFQFIILNETKKIWKWQLS